jgi:hypothetical protein
MAVGRGEVEAEIEAARSDEALQRLEGRRLPTTLDAGDGGLGRAGAFGQLALR